ncbi:MAG TPA: hypothetical protein VL738_24825 [Dactylosporangium sp.]|nr:hypothetical protein [Dactylosporangium sp.]
MAVWTTVCGAVAVPAGVAVGEALVMLVGMTVLGVAAGLWHPVR